MRPSSRSRAPDARCERNRACESPMSRKQSLEDYRPVARISSIQVKGADSSAAYQLAASMAEQRLVHDDLSRQLAELRAKNQNLRRQSERRRSQGGKVQRRATRGGGGDGCEVRVVQRVLGRTSGGREPRIVWSAPCSICSSSCCCMRSSISRTVPPAADAASPPPNPAGSATPRRTSCC